MNLPDTLSLAGQFPHSDNLLVHDNEVEGFELTISMGSHLGTDKGTDKKKKLFFDCGTDGKKHRPPNVNLLVVVRNGSHGKLLYP